MANLALLAKIGVNTEALQKGLTSAKNQISRFRKSISTGLGRAVGVLAFVTGAKAIASLGTAAAETASKFEAVFGPATSRMNAEVEKLQKTIPATKAQMQDALAVFGQMARSFGLNEKAANEFSIEMVKISGDIASFNNLKTEEAFQKIRSAITGEFEPLKSLGIRIDEARIKQEALNMGISDGTKDLSSAQKALAVQAILIRDMGVANGDAALTSNSAANQIKFLQTQLVDLATEIGVTMLPVITQLTRFMAGFVSTTVSAVEALGEFIGRAAFMRGQDDLTFQAQEQLKQEGAFEGLVGGAGQMKRKKLIQERVALLKEERKAYQEARDAAIEALKAKNEETQTAIDNSTDLVGTLESLIEREQDPARKKALEERLAALQKILSLAGELKGVDKISTTTTPEAGISSLAKIAGGGLVGEIRPLEALVEKTQKSNELLEKIVENTESTEQPEFK